jgi:hypothetical protein
MLFRIRCSLIKVVVGQISTPILDLKFIIWVSFTSLNLTGSIGFCQYMYIIFTTNIENLPKLISFFCHLIFS